MMSDKDVQLEKQLSNKVDGQEGKSLMSNQ